MVVGHGSCFKCIGGMGLYLPESSVFVEPFVEWITYVGDEDADDGDIEDGDCGDDDAEED